MRIGTTISTVYQSNDMQEYTAYKFTVVNNGGGQVDLAAFEYYTGSSWTSAATVTSLYPINGAGTGTLTVYSISKQSVRLQLRATANIDVTVTVVPYKTAPDEAPLDSTIVTALALKADLISPQFTTPATDTVAEKTADAGVTIDGVLLKDSIVKTDTIIEKTAAAGVTADGVLLKDGNVLRGSGLALGTTPVGTVSIAEYGSGKDITTVLTLTAFIVGAPGAAAAAKGFGNIVYAFPAGQHFELVSSFSALVLTAAGTAVASDTGLGSVVAVGAVSVLDGTGTFEDRLTGQTINTASGGGAAVSALKAATAGIGTGISLNVAASIKNVFLNSAGTWNVDNTGNLTASGTIVLKWTIM